MDKETWRNATKGRVGVNRFGRQGEVVQDLVRSGDTILLTTDERKLLNQDRAANQGLDVFTNGTMVPVRLIDSAEDAEQIKSNPNLKTESELKNLFKLQWRQFEKEVAKIQNSTVLLRLKELAMDADATVRQVNVIESRLSDVDPGASIPDSTIQNYGSVAPSQVPRTPAS